MNVLIITHSYDDTGIQQVTKALEEKGTTVYRFNTDLYPTHVQLSAAYIRKAHRLYIVSNEFTLEISEIDAIWYRRISVGKYIPQEIEEEFRLPSIEESRLTFQGMLSNMDCFMLDPISDIRYADNKQLQLCIARRFGLLVPDTLVTNCPKDVQQFSLHYDNIVSKMEHGFSIVDEQGEYKVYTRKLSEEDLGHLQGLEICPMIFQEYVEKKLELRVVIVGEKVFCVEIDSQSSEISKEDWRKDGEKLIDSLKPHVLPRKLEMKLLKFLRYFRLNFGAIDLILRPDNQYVFLELNPVGEFAWVDQTLEGTVSEAIASILLQEGEGETIPLKEEQTKKLKSA